MVGVQLDERGNMKRILFPILIALLAFNFASCSSKKTTNADGEAVEDQIIDESEPGEAELDVSEGTASLDGEDITTEESLDGEMNESQAVAIEDAPTDYQQQDIPDENMANTDYSSEAEASPMAAAGVSNDSGSGNYLSYTVKRGETLMEIAFKLYGNVGKWREIYRLNQDHLESTELEAGVALKYEAPSTEFNFNPEGTAYLIKRNDTLGIISKNVYDGDSSHWNYIWFNNKPLIKDPNLIYAGFTLYYLPLSEKGQRMGRGTASQF